MGSKLLPLQKNRDHDVDPMKGILITMLAIFIATIHVNGQHDVTAAQVNGTWRSGKNEFKIWALGQQKLQIEFSGVWEHQSAAGPTANTGEGSGIARIEGDTAIFKPDGAEDECKITLKFAGGKLVVSQTSTCGFGFNVTAAGTYKRVSSKKPKFGLED
jgi:hypothetical protein